jgi:rhodanese-related sulfurtransferase
MTVMSNDYAGDLAPRMVWDMLCCNADSLLVDVRTEAEWREDGVPDLSDIKREVIFVTWFGAGHGARFIQDLSTHIGSLRESSTPVLLFFMCRSGQRSKEAAIVAYAAEYHDSFNVSPGFSGDASEGNKNWKSENLPWRYINNAKL